MIGSWWLDAGLAGLAWAELSAWNGRNGQERQRSLNVLFVFPLHPPYQPDHTKAAHSSSAGVGWILLESLCTGSSCAMLVSRLVSALFQEVQDRPVSVDPTRSRAQRTALYEPSSP